MIWRRISGRLVSMESPNGAMIHWVLEQKGLPGDLTEKIAEMVWKDQVRWRHFAWRQMQATQSELYAVDYLMKVTRPEYGVKALIRKDLVQKLSVRRYGHLVRALVVAP